MSEGSLVSKKLTMMKGINLDENVDLLDSLKYCSKFVCDENDKVSLRDLSSNLKSKMEDDLITQNLQMVSILEDFSKETSKVNNDVKKIVENCQNMKQKLVQSKSDVHNMAVSLNSIKSNLAGINENKRIVDEFQHKYTLPPDVASKLTFQYDDNLLPDDFFIALDQANVTHEACKKLINSGYGGGGVSLLENVSNTQQIAYQRLFQWASRSMLRLTSDPPSRPLKQAVHKLLNRPNLFHAALDQFASRRRALLVSQFVSALTSGSRPIELTAHDPVRYVSDILAWLHQNVAAENDLLSALLKDLPSSLDSSTAGEKISNDHLRTSLLSTITGGVCNPLSGRLEQVIISETQLQTLYSLFCLLRYYADVIVTTSTNNDAESGIADKHELRVCLHSCVAMCRHGYRGAIETEKNKFVTGCASSNAKEQSRVLTAYMTHAVDLLSNPHSHLMNSEMREKDANEIIDFFMLNSDVTTVIDNPKDENSINLCQICCASVKNIQHIDLISQVSKQFEDKLVKQISSLSTACAEKLFASFNFSKPELFSKERFTLFLHSPREHVERMLSGVDQNSLRNAIMKEILHKFALSYENIYNELENKNPSFVKQQLNTPMDVKTILQ